MRNQIPFPFWCRNRKWALHSWRDVVGARLLFLYVNPRLLYSRFICSCRRQNTRSASIWVTDPVDKTYSTLCSGGEDVHTRPPPPPPPPPARMHSAVCEQCDADYGKRALRSYYVFIQATGWIVLRGLFDSGASRKLEKVCVSFGEMLRGGERKLRWWRFGVGRSSSGNCWRAKNDSTGLVRTFWNFRCCSIRSGWSWSSLGNSGRPKWGSSKRFKLNFLVCEVKYASSLVITICWLHMFRFKYVDR